jgi:hypothetical protein
MFSLNFLLQRSIRYFSIAISFCCFFISPVNAAVMLDLGTPGNAAIWRITAAGAVQAPSFQTNVNRNGSISITNNSLVSGNFVQGASASNYNGFWIAQSDFVIPSGATSVQLQFSQLWANDRVVLSLNGVPIGNATFGGGTGVGLMKLDESGSDVPYTFSELNAGTITSGFNIGGINTLRMTINNTGINFQSPTVAAAFANDGTVANLQTATLSYMPVPEPSSFLLLVGLGLVGVLHRRIV